jgi:hypothetical protein
MKTRKARVPAATMAGKITSLSLNRMKQPPKRKSTTINKNLSVARLRREYNSQCLQGQQLIE